MFYSVVFVVFFFKQKTAYEMRISDWSSDVCSSDLPDLGALHPARDRPLVPARTLTMRKQSTLGLALAGCVLTFAGCSGSPQPPAGDEMMTTPDQSFIAEEDDWRARRDEGLRNPDGWHRRIGLPWLRHQATFTGH